MKRLFKYIVRKVDEKVANSVKNVTECMKTARDIMKDKDDLRNFGILFVGVGVGVGLGVACIGTCIGTCMIMASKAM